MTASASTKIIVLIDSIKEGGGAEKNAIRLAEGLQKSEHDCLLATFYTFPDEYEYTGARVSFTENPACTLLQKALKFYRRLRSINSLIKQQQATHVIAFLEAANLSALVAQLVFRSPYKLILSVRADPRYVNWWRRQVIRFVYRRADTVVAVSRDMQRILEQEFGLTNVVTIPNPIDVDFVQAQMQKPMPSEYQFLNDLAADAKVFVNVGRLTEQKGQAALIRAFAQVHTKIKNTYLLIIGEGQKRQELEQLIIELDLTNHVLLTGHQPNIYPFLRISDCFVLASLYEGFPNVLLEAAATGLYIISTDCPTGPREIIAPDTFGQEITYPHRVSGGVLVDFNQTGNSKQMKNLYIAMLDVFDYTVTVQKAVDVTNYRLITNINSWQKVLY